MQAANQVSRWGSTILGSSPRKASMEQTVRTGNWLMQTIYQKKENSARDKTICNHFHKEFHIPEKDFKYFVPEIASVLTLI